MAAIVNEAPTELPRVVPLAPATTKSTKNHLCQQDASQIEPEQPIDNNVNSDLLADDAIPAINLLTNRKSITNVVPVTAR